MIHGICLCGADIGAVIDYPQTVSVCIENTINYFLRVVGVCERAASEGCALSARELDILERVSRGDLQCFRRTVVRIIGWYSPTSSISLLEMRTKFNSVVYMYKNRQWDRCRARERDCR